MPRHDLDAVSLICGVIFGGTALVFLVDRTTGLEGRWAWPLLLIVIGVVGLIASSRSPEDGRADEVSMSHAESRRKRHPEDGTGPAI